MSYRSDRNRNERGVMFYIRKDIPSKIKKTWTTSWYLKVYLLNWILGKLNVYFIDLNTTRHQMINTILKHYIKFSTLATAMIELF